MAEDKKISELAERQQLTGEEMIPVAEGGQNYKVKASTVKTYSQPDLTPYAKTADVEKTYLKKADAQNTYQPKGNYVTNEALEQKGYETTEHAQETYQPKGNYLTSVPGEYVTETELEAKDYETKTNASQTYATKDELGEVAAGLEAVKPYCLARWDDDELDPDAVETAGNTEMLSAWFPFLLDTTDNAGVTTKPVGRLKKNNYLRFEDGSFAPTVGITEEQRAQCDVELYLNPEHTEKYCDAGAFDAEAFYKEYGMSQKLYNASGEEITHILRPWETTETKYTIGIGREDTVYLVDQMKGSSGKVWRGVSRSPRPTDGVDAGIWPLVPTTISPCPVCTVGGKTRNFFYLYEGETNCKSGAGQEGLCTMFQNGRTYPRITDMNQTNNMNYARANNADNTKPYPFAEGGDHSWNTFVTCLEVLHGTKALHRDTLFASGISSNDGCSDEASWLEHGGVRFKLHAAGTWSYGKWSDQKDIYYNSTQGRASFSALLNQEYPKEQCMESQMAASFAVETGVAEGEEFSFYGGTYWYKNPTGVSGVADGEMNVRVYKKMAQTFDAYDSAGAQQSWDVEVVLRMGLALGVNMSGDIFAYWGGGYEQVATVQHLQDEQRTGNKLEFYVEPDQTKWLRETAVTKNDLGTFSFEGSYRKVDGDFETLGDGYASKRQPYTGFRPEKGGSILTGECFYMWDNNYFSNTLNQRVRLAVRRRGHALNAYCAPRSLPSHHPASRTTRALAGSAQALIQVGAAPPQAE